MKKLWWSQIIVLIFVLSACSNSEENEETSNDSTEETETEKSTESTDDETEDNEPTEEEGSKDESTEEDSTTEKQSDDSEGENEESTDTASEDPKADLYFDLNAPEVQAQFFSTTEGNEDGTFQQDLITNGMTQTEVEEKYGTYEFTFPTGGGSPAIYGNLGVMYSERAPYGTGEDDSSNPNINPDENYVEYVWYYARVTGDELTQILGEPDVYQEEESMNGLPFYVYQGEGEDGRYYSTGASTYNSPDGEMVGLVKREIFDELPGEDNAMIEADEEEAISVIEETYPPLLADYYNNETENVTRYVAGDALEKIQANRESGDFAVHQSISMEITNVEQLSDTEYQITANRTYSHASSNGEQTEEVTYTLTQDGNTFVITNFE